MINFILNNWMYILDSIISLIIGFLGGLSFKSIKNKSKIKGNHNNVIQKGNNND